MPGVKSKRVLRKKSEAMLQACLNTSVKFPASQMIWGCISGRGVGRLCFVNGTVNSQKYQDLLKDYLLPSIPALQSTEGEFIFQQDGATCHTAKTSMQWMAQNGVPVITWPPNSPDISPIEALWGHMKKELSKSPAKTIDELKFKLQTVWTSITPETCQHIVDTMPERVADVIKAKGGATKW